MNCQWKISCRLSRVMGCSERQRLLNAAIEAVEEIRATSEQLSVILQTADARTSTDVFRRLAAAERDRDQRLKALIDHDREHACSPEGAPHGK